MTEEIISVPRTEVVHTEFLEQARGVVEDVVKTKNFDKGFEFVRMMKEMKNTLDDGTGIALSGMEEIWKPSEHDGELFEQAVVRKTGLELVTIQRHIKIQRALPSVPEEYREEILDMGFKEKIRIAALVEGGYEVSETDWRDLAEAPTTKEVDRIARKIKGVEPRTNFLAITIDKNGLLVAHTSRGRFEVGRLNVLDDNPDIQKAISRLTSCTNVIPASEY